MNRYPEYFKSCTRLLLLVVLAGLGGCFGGGGGDGDAATPTDTGAGIVIEPADPGTDTVSSDPDSVDQVVIAGSVGDGPVVGASINIFNSDGQLLETVTSDNTATFSTELRLKGREYPLTLEVVGGTDLVTGAEPDFNMKSVMLKKSDRQVNISPFTTMQVLVAERLPGGINDINMGLARSYVLDAMSFGLDTVAVQDPITTTITDANAANMIKSSEIAGEMVRRTRDRLAESGIVLSGNQVMIRLAADITDGRPDGAGSGEVDARVTAYASIISAEALVESLSNNLRVHGVIATGVIDQAIITTHPGVQTSQLTASVPVTARQIEQAYATVAAAQVLDPSFEVQDLEDRIATITPGALPAQVETILPADSARALGNAISLLATADDQTIRSINEVVANGGNRGGGGQEANIAPVISGTPAPVINAGELYDFLPVASDGNGDTLSFSITGKPSWATFNPVSGSLIGTPAETDAGLHEGIVVSVTDGVDTVSLPAFSIRVDVPVQEPVNSAPTISGNPATVVLAGNSYSFTPTAQDSDGDVLTFGIVNLPHWASFDATTGQLQGIPAGTDVGEYPGIGISVTDGVDTVSLASYTIRVDAVDTGTVPADLVITDLNIPDGYVWSALAAGGLVYVDRSYTYQDVPAEFAGLAYLRTANNDKYITDSAFIAFSVSNAVYVYVAVDALAADLPAWLGDWEVTGMRLGAQATMNVYRRYFPAGNVVLGGNEVGFSMYTLFVQDAGGAGAGTGGAPSMSLDAPASTASGGNAVIVWNSANTTGCVASGDWSGARTTSGTESVGPLFTDSVFTLTCSGADGSVEQTRTVTVTEPDPLQPTVSISANPVQVNAGNATVIEWTSSNADSCTASGGWTGSKATSGSESTAVLQQDTTYVLECSGAGGNASDAVTVLVQQVLGSVNLSWTPPTTNEDGSLLQDLAGYNIYYGTVSGSYPNRQVINNAGLSSYTLENLPAATYYFVITAFDTSGNESRVSNEAVASVSQ